MKTKERLITMMLALMAMFMGTTVMAQEAYAVYNASTKTLSFYYDNDKSSWSGVDVYDLNAAGENPGWNDEHKADIKTVEFHESFKNARPTNTASWFAGPLYGQESQLEHIYGLENLNTSEVTSMSGMFICCKKLTTLDLRNFDTRNVTNMGWMFSQCTNLRTIIVGSNWDTSNVESSTSMFGSCRNLIGGAGTGFDSNYTDKTYAHIDGENNTPGYLSSVEQANKEPYVVYDSSTKTLTFYCDGNKGTNAYELNSADEYPMWIANQDDIQKVVFTDNFKIARPTSTYCWFNGLSNLTTIEGIDNLNTSKVTNMSCMFSSCTSLTSLSLGEHFYTGSVTDMGYMFDGCENLTSLTLGDHFDTGSVTSMVAMFGWCSSLASIDVSRFNTTNVLNMASMFASCNSLESLNLRSFVTQRVNNMGCMFLGCNKLTDLDVSTFHTSSVENMELMFYGCSGLSALDLTNFDTREVTNMDGMFGGCSTLKTIYVGDNWITNKVTVSATMFESCYELVGGIGTYYDSNYMDVTYAHIDGIGGPGYLTSRDREAYAEYDSNTKTLTFYYDTQKGNKTGTTYPIPESNYEDPNWIWNDIVKVEFNSSFAGIKPTTTHSWFNDADGSIKEIVGLDYLNTSDVVDMSSMFEGCSGLTSIVLNSFNTDNVVNMYRMFNGCSGLESITFGSGFNTKSLENANMMFNGCSSLTSIDLSMFNTDKATNMGGMFSECHSLKSINMSSFDTSSVTAMNSMFYFCENLTTLDLRGFDTQNVTNMSYMFYGCTNLKTIAVSDAWSTTNVESSQYMFDSCTNVVGGKGTIYNNEKIDKEYARVDEGPNSARPGYFSSELQPGISTGICDAYGQRDSVKGQRDERYNLSGQRVGKDYKGIVIQNGKKTVVK